MMCQGSALQVMVLAQVSETRAGVAGVGAGSSDPYVLTGLSLHFVAARFSSDC
jgi:hypothetical protein